MRDGLSEGWKGGGLLTTDNRSLSSRWIQVTKVSSTLVGFEDDSSFRTASIDSYEQVAASPALTQAPQGLVQQHLTLLT